jgi:hypothetical protein
MSSLKMAFRSAMVSRALEERFRLACGAALSKNRLSSFCRWMTLRFAIVLDDSRVVRTAQRLLSPSAFSGGPASVLLNKPMRALDEGL